MKSKDRIGRDGYDLTEPQQRALASLLEGTSVTEAASRAGVSRQAVSGWRNQNAVFVAALNAGARDRITQARTQLLGLVPKAITVLMADMEKGGEPASRAARDILRALERLSIDKVGSADPVLVESQMADERFSALLLQLREPRPEKDGIPHR